MFTIAKLNRNLLWINFLFIQSYLIKFNIGSYPTNLLEITIALNAITFLAWKIKDKNLLRTFLSWKKNSIIYGLAGLTALSLLFSLFGLTNIENQLDFFRHGKFIAFGLTLSFIAVNSISNKKQWHQTLEVAGIGAILFGLFSLAFNLLGHNTTHDLRLLGPLDAAVYLAYYLTPFFLFFSFKFAEERTVKYLIRALTLLALIIATRSMGAIGGSFLIIILYAITKTNILKRKGAKPAFALLTLAVTGLIFYTKILPTLQTNYSSLDERGEIWQTSAAMLKNPQPILFGVGLGQFEQNFINNAFSVLGRPPLDQYVIQPHNIFLLFQFHFGILGLIFILLIYIKTAKNVFNCENSNYIATLILLYFLIHGLIDTPIFKNDLLPIFLILAQITFTPLLSSQKPIPSKPYKDRQP